MSVEALMAEMQRRKCNVDGQKRKEGAEAKNNTVAVGTYFGLLW